MARPSLGHFCDGAAFYRPLPDRCCGVIPFLGRAVAVILYRCSAVVPPLLAAVALPEHSIFSYLLCATKRVLCSLLSMQAGGESNGSGDSDDDDEAVSPCCRSVHPCYDSYVMHPKK
jgi:hypothetical protein